MIKLISSKAASILCSDDDKDTFEIYEYAIYITLSGLFHILTVLLIGICFNMLIESVVFYGSFILIRKFAGGYHAKTPTRCYTFSVLVSIAVLYFIKVMYEIYSTSLIVCLLFIEMVCVILIFYNSPLQSDNKPLDIKEKGLYKKVARIIVSIIFVFSITLAYLGLKIICIPMIFGVYVSGLVLVMRKIQIVLNKSALFTDL